MKFYVPSCADLGHYNMKAYLDVMSQEDFEKWMKEKVSEQ